MAYKTKWALLDRKGVALQNFERICFSNHIDSTFLRVDEDDYQNSASDTSRKPGTPHYLQYQFDNAKVTDGEMQQYFRFIRATPEFAHLMPKSIKKMVASKTYTANLTKVNGLQLFTILTLLRAVVEEPKTVRSVIQFDHKRQHALSHLSILKAAGQQSDNFHHWITGSLKGSNLVKGINEENRDAWDDPTPALETGLIAQIHATFQHEGDGFYVTDRVPYNWDKALLAAQPRKPRIDIPVVKRIKPFKTSQPDSLAIQQGYAPW